MLECVLAAVVAGDSVATYLSLLIVATADRLCVLEQTPGACSVTVTMLVITDIRAELLMTLEEVAVTREVEIPNVLDTTPVWKIPPDGLELLAPLIAPVVLIGISGTPDVLIECVALVVVFEDTPDHVEPLVTRSPTEDTVENDTPLLPGLVETVIL